MEQRNLDTVIVGAGFSGMYLLHLLRAQGCSARVLEAGSGVGGTWYWNRYPGARCDSESMTYSYSFDEDLDQKWSWPERYSRQPQILEYLNHVAERYDLRRDIDFDTRVTAATFDEDANRWTVHTDAGEDITARFYVMATGCLSLPKLPTFEGLESFEGEWYHTGLWPHEDVDFTGKRVAVVGTGSTAIQAIPKIAEQAKQLTVFQRTANFSVPAWNHTIGPEYEQEWKSDYPEIRDQMRWSTSGSTSLSNPRTAAEMTPEERQVELEERWRGGSFSMLGAFADLMTDLDANALAVKFVHAKYRSRVHDPEVADLLCPKDHPFGTKRLCVDSDYYETYNRDNVTLVDIKHAPIERLTSEGLVTGGKEYAVDAIVFAIGFDAMTGPLLDVDIRGRGGKNLRDKWSDGPRTYLGLTVAGFPNLFAITGPGSPSVLTNMPVAIEQHVEWVADCIRDLRADNIESIEATTEAEDEWVEHVETTANQTLYPHANSWYMGANVPGKPRVFTPYVGTCHDYRKRCDEIAADGYRGFELGRAAAE